MKYLQPYLYEIIRKLIDHRKSVNSFPCVATEMEVFTKIHEDVDATISEMEADGLLAHHENINGIRMFRDLKDSTNENNNVQ